jgi:hypothetical protein
MMERMRGIRHRRMGLKRFVEQPAGVRSILYQMG